MKIIYLFIFLVVSQFSVAQISGALIDEGRELISDVRFIQEGKVNGSASFEVSVDREGNVSGVKLVATTLKSTPTKIRLHNYAKTLKFQPGTYYPKFHHAIVKFTVVRPE